LARGGGYETQAHFGRGTVLTRSPVKKGAGKTLTTKKLGKKGNSLLDINESPTERARGKRKKAMSKMRFGGGGKGAIWKGGGMLLGQPGAPGIREYGGCQIGKRP